MRVWERGSLSGPRVLAGLTGSCGTVVHQVDGCAGPPPCAPPLAIRCGPGVARQQGLFGLVSLLRNVRAQCESKKEGNPHWQSGRAAGERGPAVGAFCKVP